MSSTNVRVIPGLHYSCYVTDGRKEWKSNTGFIPGITERKSRKSNKSESGKKPIPNSVAKWSTQSELQISNGGDLRVV